MIDVGALDDFEPRKPRLVDVEGLALGVVRWRDDEVYAIANRCPHQGAPLCAGNVGPKLVGTPGAVEVDPDRPVITCAWHHWEFELKTGQSVWDPRYRAKTYPVKVENDRVLIELRRRSRAMRAPAAAERA
jgi:nitrite reductase (NADH) small subunit